MRSILDSRPLEFTVWRMTRPDSTIQQFTCLQKCGPGGLGQTVHCYYMAFSRHPLAACKALNG